MNVMNLSSRNITFLTVISAVILVLCHIAALSEEKTASNLAVIEKITGKISKQELAFDGKPGTAAVITRLKNEKSFEFTIYFKEWVEVESLSLSSKQKPGSIKLLASTTGAEWNEVPVKISTTHNKPPYRINIDINDPSLTRLLKFKLDAEKNTSLSIYEVTITKIIDEEIRATDIRVENITETTADIVFHTQKPAIMNIKISPDRPLLDQTLADNEPKRTHRMFLTKLNPGTEYYFQIIHQNGLKTGLNASPVTVFKTSGDPLPQILSVELAKPGYSSAHLEVAADKPVKWRVRYGLYREDQSIESALVSSDSIELISDDYSKAGTFNLTDLSSKTKYFLLVIATDSRGKKTSTDLLGFETE